MSDEFPPGWPTEDQRARVDARSRALRARRRFTGAAALAVVIVVAAGGVAIARGGSNGSDVRVATRPTTTTAPPAAHAIVSAPEPKGWRLVDFGDARFALPPGWSVAPPTGTSPAPCATSTEGGVVFYRSAPNCPTITIGAPPAAELPQRPITTVNGFALYLVADDSLQSTTYVAPALHVAITIHDQAGAPVLRTLTSSARRVVLGPGDAPTVPSDWKTLTFGGISLRVPPTMPVSNLAANEIPPGECTAEPFPKSGAFVGDGQPGVVHCPMIAAGVVPVPTDGVWMHTDRVQSVAKPTAFVRTISVGPLTIAIADANGYVAPGLNPALDLTIFDGASRRLPTAIRLGLGADPTVARTILYSIRPAAASGN